MISSHTCSEQGAAAWSAGGSSASRRCTHQQYRPCLRERNWANCVLRRARPATPVYGLAVRLAASVFSEGGTARANPRRRCRTSPSCRARPGSGGCKSPAPTRPTEARFCPRMQAPPPQPPQARRRRRRRAATAAAAAAGCHWPTRCRCCCLSLALRLSAGMLLAGQGGSRWGARRG